MPPEDPPAQQPKASGLWRLAGSFRRRSGASASPADEPSAEPAPEPAAHPVPHVERVDEPPEPLVPPDVARRIEVPLTETAPELHQWREIQSGFAKLAERGLWPSLFDRLRGTDQSRQEFSSGLRYCDCALSGAMDLVTRHLEGEGGPRIEDALAELPLIETLRSASPRDYVPAVVLARSLIAIGEAIRGAAPPSRTPADRLAAARPHYARAEEVLEAFDPIERNSPMIAEARYRLVPGVRDGVDFLRDWYEDWADLDPANPIMLTTHSHALFPTWYGSYAEIELEARRAAERASDSIAAGAYAWFWWEALDTDPAPALTELDVVLFFDGMHQLLGKSSSQDLVNRAAALLYRVGHAEIDPGASDAGKAILRREAFRRGFGEVLRRHLRELHTVHWPYSPDGIRAAVAQAFLEDLAGGAVIAPGKRGLEANRVARD
jgi:hypothetical protein